MWDDDVDGENWISDSNDSESETIPDYDHAFKLNVDQALHWGNMAEEEPFQSWEAMADAQFEAAIAKDHNDNSSILNQDFPPLGGGSPVTLPSHESNSSQSINNSTSKDSEYTPSPIKTRAQRLKKRSTFISHQANESKEGCQQRIESSFKRL